MQIRYQIQARPVRTLVAALVALVAMLVALAALLATGALGSSLGRMSSAGPAILAPRQSLAQPATGSANGNSAFRYGPADRAGSLSTSQVPAHAHASSSFPQGPADRAGS